MTSPRDLAKAEGVIENALKILDAVTIDSTRMELYEIVVKAAFALSARQGVPRALTELDTFPCLSFSAREVRHVLDYYERSLVDEDILLIDLAEEMASDIDFDAWTELAYDWLKENGYLKDDEPEDEEEYWPKIDNERPETGAEMAERRREEEMLWVIGFDPKQLPEDIAADGSIAVEEEESALSKDENGHNNGGFFDDDDEWGWMDDDIESEFDDSDPADVDDYENPNKRFPDGPMPRTEE